MKFGIPVIDLETIEKQPRLLLLYDKYILAETIVINGIYPIVSSAANLKNLVFLKWMSDDSEYYEETLDPS